MLHLVKSDYQSGKEVLSDDARKLANVILVTSQEGIAPEHRIFDLIGTKRDTIRMSPHIAGQIFFVSLECTAEMVATQAERVSPTAIVRHHEEYFLIYAFNEVVDEYDYRITTIMASLGMNKFTRDVPLPGLDGSELVMVDATKLYAVDELVRTLSLFPVPATYETITSGSRYGAATVKTSFSGLYHKETMIDVATDRNDDGVNTAMIDQKSVLGIINAISIPSEWHSTPGELLFAKTCKDTGCADDLEALTGLVVTILPGEDLEGLDDVLRAKKRFAVRVTKKVYQTTYSTREILSGATDIEVTNAMLCDWIRQVEYLPKNVVDSMTIATRTVADDGDILLEVTHDAICNTQVLTILDRPMALADLCVPYPEAFGRARRVIKAFGDQLPAAYDYHELSPLTPLRLPQANDGCDYEIAIFDGTYTSMTDIMGDRLGELTAPPVPRMVLAVPCIPVEEDDGPSFRNALRFVEAANLGIAYDVLGQREVLRAEYLPWPDDFGREFNDDLLRIIRKGLLEWTGLEFSKDNVQEAVKTIAQHNRFHPVVEWLNRLVWDGVPRLDTWLTTYAGVKDSEYARAVGAIMLIAAVRRARQPGVKFDTAVFFEGVQGIDKSSLIAALGGEWYSDGELGNVADKEAAINLQGVWIQELPELTALSNSEHLDLKAFMSRRIDRYRAPYDRSPRSVPRQCIFVGTTNDSAYLRDLTGNRRYWPVKVGVINLVAFLLVRDQLFAEAAYREARGESIVLPKHLWEVAGEEQAARQIEEPWMQPVSAYLEGKKRVHTFKILTDALQLHPSQANQAMAKRLRAVMMAIGSWTAKRAIRIDGESAAGYESDE